jgi:hypothetical protein
MPFRKIDPRIWGDAKFRRLSDDAKLLWMYLLTNNHLTNLPGVFHAWPETMGRDIGWSGDDPQNFRFETAFKEITDLKMAIYDDTGGLIYIPRAYFFNLPDNLNVVKGWAVWFFQLPECPLRERILNDFKHNLERYRKGYSEPFTKPYEEPLAKPYAKQERRGKERKGKERKCEGEDDGSSGRSPQSSAPSLASQEQQQEEDRLTHLSKTDPSKFSESLPPWLQAAYKKSKGMK